MKTGKESASLPTGNSTGLPNSDTLGKLELIAFDAIVGFDAQERITFWNPAAEQMYGWTASEVLGKNVVELLWPRLSPTNQQDQTDKMSRLKQGETLRGQYQARRKDDSFFWVDYSACGVSKGDSRFSGYIAILRDITDRKRFEHELQFTSKLPAENPNPVMRLTRSGRLLYANDSCTIMLETWKQSGHEIPLELQRHAAEAMASGGTKEIELKHKDRIFAFTLAPNVEAGYVNFYGNDITDRKQTAEALRQSEEHLRVTFNSSVVGFATLDPSTRFLEVNEAFCNITGYSREELLQMDCAALTQAQHIEYTNKYIRRLIDGEIPSFVIDKIYIRKDGEEVWVQNNVSLVRDAEDKPLHLIAICQDITERKRSEQSLVEYARQQEALFTLSDQLQRAYSLEDVYDASLDAIISALECDRASILLFDDTDTMHFAAWRGLSDAYRQATDGHSPWKRDEGYPEPICMDDIETANLSDPLKAVIRNEGIGSLAFIPLVTNGSLIGKFMAYYNTPHIFTESQIDLGLTIAHQLAFGIDRKRADKALRHRAAQFETLLNQAPVGVYLVDATFRIREVNPVALPVFGDIPDLIGMDLAEVMYRLWRKEYADEVVRLFRHTLETGEPYHTAERVEYRIDRERNEYYEWRIDRIPLPDSRYGVVCYFRDISAQVLAREKIRESEERFRTLANTMPSIVWTSTPDGQITYGNDHGLQFVGLQSADSPIQWPAQVLHPDDYERCIREWSRALKTVPDEYVMEVRLRRHDGEYRWFQMRSVPVRDENGKVKAWYGVGTDIDDRIHAENALRESEAKLQVELADSKQLQRISSQLIQEDNISILYKQIVEAATALMRADMGSMQMLSPEKNELQLLAWRGFHPEAAAFWERVGLNSGGTCAQALRISERVTVADVETSDFIGSQDLKYFRLSGIKAIQSTPLVSRDGRLVGMISTHWRESHQPSERELHLLDVLARQAADLIDRKRSEEALRGSEERYRTIVETANEGIWYVDLSSTTVYLNEPMARILGYSAPELSGRKVTEFCFAEDVAEAQARLGSNFQGNYEHFDFRFRCKDGSEVLVLASTSPVSDAAGNIVGALGMFVNVTERKRAEERERVRAAEMEAIMESTPTVIWITSDPECHFITGNRAAYEVLRLPPGTNTSMSAPDGMRPINFSMISDGRVLQPQELPIQRAARGEEVRDFEMEVRHKDGTSVFLLGDATPLRDAQNNICGAVAAFIDITARKQAEDAVRASEALYRTMARSIPDGGVYVIDKDFRYVVAEGSVSEAFGFSREMLEGHTVAEVFPPEPARRMEERLRQNFAGETISFETERDGHVYWTQQAPLLNSMGHAIVLTLDITERKQAEEALRESRERYRNLFDLVPVAVYTCDARGHIQEFNHRAVDLWGREPNVNDPNEKYCGSFKIYYPDGRFMPHDKCPMSRVLAGQTIEAHELEILVERPDGVRRNVLAHPLVLRNDHGEIIGAINCLYDITERKEMEQALRIRARQQQAVAKLGELALRERDLQKVFDYSTALVAETLENEYCKVLELLPGGEELLLRSGVGWRTGLVGKATVSAGQDSQAGYTLLSDLPVVVSDLREETRFSGPALLLEHGVVSGMSCIIRNKDGSPWGVLGTHTRRHQTFTLDDASFLIAVANVLGEAIHREKTEQALRENEKQLALLNETLEHRVREQTAEVRRLASDLTKAEQRERHRISHILHDDLQQRLYAIQMQMTFWSDRFMIADDDVRRELASIKEQLDDVLAVTRHLSVDLSPPILHDEGLSHAIRWLSAQMQEQHGLKVRLQAEEAFAIPNEELQVLLFNCVRELLFNIVKHAGVKEAEVSLQRSNASLQIDVRDLGKGFLIPATGQPAADKRKGDEDVRPSFGLLTMRHQLSLFGGQMEIKSQPGAGTHVTLKIPVYEHGPNATEQLDSPSI